MCVLIVFTAIVSNYSGQFIFEMGIDGLKIILDGTP
jgi:hypothetical protein